MDIFAVSKTRERAFFRPIYNRIRMLTLDSQIWILVCMSFVVATVAEYAAILAYQRVVIRKTMMTRYVFHSRLDFMKGKSLSLSPVIGVTCFTWKLEAICSYVLNVVYCDSSAAQHALLEEEHARKTCRKQP